MLNLLKWNSLDFLHRYAWVFIVAAVTLITAVFIPNGIGAFYAMLIDLVMVMGILFFCAAIVFTTYQHFSWLNQNSSLLEFSLPAPAWKLLLSRVIMGVVLNALACLGILALMLLFGKFTVGTVEPINASQLGTIGGLVVVLLVVNMTILFSYLIARSIGLFRLPGTLITALLASILLIIILGFSVYVMLWTNVLKLPFLIEQDMLSMDGIFQIHSYIPALATYLWVSLLEYLGSCLLLKYCVQAD